jgi:hypothetical protein
MNMKDELFENQPTILSYRRAKAVPPEVMAKFRYIVSNNKRRSNEKGKGGKRPES